MATYDLNEELKKREKTKVRTSADGEVALDDVSRVKVLSPGRQVFKRFIRNRLAVFGSVLLIVMFVFSFLGPLAYPYGQKQIFRKFASQNVNYALAKENTAYNGYDVNTEAAAERSVVNAMNSNIKKMAAADQEEMVVVGKDGTYLIKKEMPNIYTLSVLPAEQVCTLGNSTVKIGTYSMIGKKLDFEVDEIPGLAQEAAKNIKGKAGSFTFDGATYTFDKGDKPKTFFVFSEMNGLVYTGDEKDKDFEDALNAAVEAGESSFSVKDATYVINAGSDHVDVYETGEPTVSKVYTTYTLDTFESGIKVADDLRPAALMAAAADGSFEAGGESYTIKEADGGLVIFDKNGDEYAEFSLFSVRRYSGEDTMSYDLKKAISGRIEEMLRTGEKSGTLNTQIPQQDENGAYIEDEEGNYVLSETEMKITQRLEGEYVINCDQINYVIDIFGSPSAKHILGTDGDGFDVLARIMYGGRVSLMVGFIVVIIETILGVIMGGLAGYFGGWVDNLIMRLVDIFYCLPSLPIMIILGAMMDAQRLDTYIRLCVMMAALGIMGWAGVARLVRGQILSLREQEFMVATEATGIRIKDRIFKHLIPNVMPQLIVTATMSLGGVIITESTLSFLGLGVKHPLATWGTIINSVSSASAMAHYAFIWIPVGLLICLTVIAFNFVGDGLRDAYDPKSKR